MNMPMRRSEMTTTFALVEEKLRSIGSARFTFFKAEKSSSTALRDIDLVFLCDATGGMENGDALDGVRVGVSNRVLITNSPGVGLERFSLRRSQHGPI